MPKEKEGSWPGGNGKKALEPEDDHPAYRFLDDLGIRPEEIVRIGVDQANGHPLSIAWIGTDIGAGDLGDLSNLSIKSILKAEGTGCLETIAGQKCVRTFIKEGVVLEPEDVDSRQGRMDLNL